MDFSVSRVDLLGFSVSRAGFSVSRVDLLGFSVSRVGFSVSRVDLLAFSASWGGFLGFIALFLDFFGSEPEICKKKPPPRKSQ